jgi:hypothetical protein
MQFFGGWARESDVVLDYIDQTVLPSPGAWQLLGWMTHGGAPPNVTRKSATDGMSERQHNLNGHIGSIEVWITWLELRINMRYLRQYISPNGSSAHARTDSKMSAQFMTH